MNTEYAEKRAVPTSVLDDGIRPDEDFATNADLRRMELGTRWVWNRWLQAGTVNLLAAEGGLGKTRFVADLCRRVHAGLPWPDGGPTDPWSSQYLAMWVAGDRNQGELLTLSEGFGFGERICYSGSKAGPLGGVTLDTPGEFVALHRKLKAARPLFLVVDTAGGATGFNLAKQEEARAFFAPLSDMAARLGLCVVVITHLNASKTVLGRRAEERVRCVIRMSAENREPETLRRVEVLKSNGLYPQPIGMLLGDTGNEYTDEAPAAPETQASASKGSQSRTDESDRGPRTKTRECMDWLTQTLAETPMRVHTLRKQAEEKGFSTTTFYKAKEMLNLVEAVAEGYKLWGLRK
ncbi:AAA family ATPase [Fimbriiglobus ruber]|uniref:TnpY n=1 Tax=Fimbriiglobus ruber TaxID=1908690 RepID=A0A225DQK6_9BACT|nr:AAA family ATPase [Fimbriiglobus ruber]OWK43672.1 TnpY [Fimbriiglobus ruber]